LSASRIIVLAGSLLSLACAPEPTTPADTDISGVWTSNVHLFALSELKLTLTQEPRGIVSGGWSAKRDGGSDASGLLIGRNMVSQIELDLLGAGKFEGTLIEPNRLRGILAVGIGYDTITFVK
jgi:hypothetical protein